MLIGFNIVKDQRGHVYDDACSIIILYTKYKSPWYINLYNFVFFSAWILNFAKIVVEYEITCMW